MTQEINLQNIVEDTVQGYILFRKIEDWCLDNLDKMRWRFSYSPSTCVYGIDIPGRIFFDRKEDLEVFELTFINNREMVLKVV